MYDHIGLKVRVSMRRCVFYKAAIAQATFAMGRREKRQTARVLCASTVLGLATLGSVAWAQVNCNVGIEFYPSGTIRSCNLKGQHRNCVELTSEEPTASSKNEL